MSGGTFAIVVVVIALIVLQMGRLSARSGRRTSQNADSFGPVGSDGQQDGARDHGDARHDRGGHGGHAGGGHASGHGGHMGGGHAGGGHSGGDAGGGGTGTRGVPDGSDTYAA